MVESDFLQVYDLYLTTASPLFIGDGAMILKKNYLFDPRSETVTIFDERKFFELLVAHNLIDQYEAFIMANEQQKLYTFLKEVCRLSEKDWSGAVRYTLGAKDSLDANHTLKDIHTFVRDSYGRAYVPGSSVKGALRTVLLNERILKSPSPKEPIPKSFSALEGNYLHTLKLDKKKTASAVNSIMRGIHVSDSLPISDEAMMLARKKDAHTDGSFSAGKGVLCREAVRPGTRIHLKLTLDQSVLKQHITAKSLAEMIDRFDAYYADTYLPYFEEPEQAGDYPYENSLILGGGAGFFSKSLVYPYLGYEKALQKTAEQMQRQFRKHHHNQDAALGISPHTMEYTKYKAAYYPMGLCEVEIC